MGDQANRRDFLKTAAAGASGYLILGQSQSALSYQANEKLNIALIGVGEQGRGFIRRVRRIDHNLVALCDVDQRRIEAAGEVPGARVYSDFRRLLDEMDRELDAVIIATPHHSQPSISAAAMRRGKHVYCEKPIAHDVGEARAIRRLANETGVVTQMGNQGVATDSFRRVLEQAQDGRVGEIREAHLWFVRGGEAVEVPTEGQPIPDGFDWDLFLGPAGERPYHEAYMKWPNWRDFATGFLGMGGSHSMHMTFNALDLRRLWEGNDGASANIRVEAECSGGTPAGFPVSEFVRYDIPARGTMPPARIHWYNAPESELVQRGVLADLEKIAGRSLDWGEGWASRSGSLLVGSKGVVHTNPHNSLCALLPLEDFPDQGGRPQRIPRAGSHEREWAAACQGGRTPFSNFDYAGPVIELLLLGNICTALGRAIEYDPVAGSILNDAEADQMLRPPRRDGWTA